jgi:hypothetical protein
LTAIMPAVRRTIHFACAAALAALAAGCATYTDRLHEVRTWYYAGDLARAEATIDEYLKKPKNDADVLKMERSMVELAAGRPQEAERTLREVRDRLDYLEQASAGEAALSMVTDDNAQAYAGEDYEKVLVRSFLALASLVQDGGDAGAYGLQAAAKQEQIIQAGADPKGDNPKLSYKRVALGAYVHAVMREETFMDYDDAARSFARVVSWEPEFPFGRHDLERAQRGSHSGRGNGVLYVFALVGRGPYKTEVMEIPSTVAMLVADRIISATGKHTLTPTVAPIKVPKVVVSPNQVRGVEVSVDGRAAGLAATITDVGQLAVQQYEAIYPQVLGRAVARRAVKKGILYAGKEAAQVTNASLLNVAFDVGGVVWEATESADTRCWGLLPDRIQVLRLELPAGQHRVGLRPTGHYGAIGGEASSSVRILDGRNTYLLANFPDDRLVGKILSSQN